MEVKWRLLSIFWKLGVVVKRLQHRSRRWQLFASTCLLTFFATSCYLLLLCDYTPVPDRAVSFRLIQRQLWDSIGNSSEEVGCEFPALDPYSEEAMRFNRDVPKITCEGEDWVECYLSECKVKKAIFKTYRKVACSYKNIIYVNDKKYYIGAATRILGEGTYNLNRSDHVKVSCSGIDKSGCVKSANPHLASVVDLGLNPSHCVSIPEHCTGTVWVVVIDGLGLLSTRWHGNKAGLRPVPRQVPPGRQGTLNVLIIAFDSTSRFGFMRRMPRSYRVLTEELQATVLKGFHILGDGTPATLFPLLSGKTELEHPDSRKKFTNGQFLDPKQFIFHAIEKDGYHTAYLEDMPWIGSFQYRYNGFSGTPADHYLQPFYMEEIGYGLKLLSSSKYCVGATPQYLFMLNLTRQFMETEGKKFGFTFIADISHDDFNLITTADDDFVEYLREFRRAGKLKDTMLIVMGDHGTRFSPIRETYQGKIEERLPLMTIVLPEKLLEQRAGALEALKRNQEVLTTPFDVHTTVLDAMGLKELSNGFKVPGSDLPRGMSLLEPIPKSRSCGQAAILPHWCVCTKWTEVAQTEPLHATVAQLLARYINNITQEQRELCAERTLTSVEWVLRHGTNRDLLRFRRGRDGEGLYAKFVTTSHMVKPYVEDYQAKIVMAPGRAVYEGTMKYYAQEDRFVISESEISRITAYKNEPECVSKTHPHLNKYCYCKNTEVTKQEKQRSSLEDEEEI